MKKIFIIIFVLIAIFFWRCNHKEEVQNFCEDPANQIFENRLWFHQNEETRELTAFALIRKNGLGVFIKTTEWTEYQEVFWWEFDNQKSDGKLDYTFNFPHRSKSYDIDVKVWECETDVAELCAKIEDDNNIFGETEFYSFWDLVIEERKVNEVRQLTLILEKGKHF